MSDPAPRTRVTSVASKTRARTRSALPVSRQQDPFTQLYSDGLAIPPPYAYATLARLYDVSDALLTVIAAMETNVSGFGWQLVPVDKDRVEKDATAAAAEKLRLEGFLRYMHVDGGLVALRRRTRVDIEVYGDGYWEILRNALGEVAGVAHMRAHWVRKGKLSEPVEVQRPVQGPDGTWSTVKQLRRFRTYVQRVNGIDQWFKSLGDPRPIHAKTGEPDPTAAPADLATEVLNFSLYAPDSPYGKPRWRGASDDVSGRAAAAQVNSSVFENKGIPPFLILVQGALLGPDAVTAVKDHFEGAKGAKNWHAPLIIEAESGATGPTGEGPIPPVRIDVKDLTEGVQKDALFKDYRVAAADSIAMTFRVPRILVGRSQDYNRATADAARSVAEEQVFGPERGEEDEVFNREILPLLGARYWKVRTAPPPSLDEDQLASLVKVAIEAGAITPAQAAQVLGPLLGLDLSLRDAWAQVPVKVLAVLLEKGWVIDGVRGIAPASTGAADPNAAAGDPTTDPSATPVGGTPADPATDPNAEPAADPNAADAPAG